MQPPVTQRLSVNFEIRFVKDKAVPIINRFADMHQEMIAWRRDIHAHPELGFEEQRTSDMVAEKLAAFGCEVHNPAYDFNDDALPAGASVFVRLTETRLGR
ncbi:MAG: hypothetical protein BMS9Abin01_0442 [Gammaproteobacteria bacterium]|nr:MAG: hypothetical protein BMS9Abin01_0442 [Gammaproteobacteria bacterium]